jgi:acyl-CoA thioester hydrolase
MVSVSELRVRYAETDQMGVVYHANYLAWCEIGRTDLIRALGTPYAEVERQGVALAVAEANLRYVRAARYDDLIRVVTTVNDVRSRSVTFGYRIMRVEGSVPGPTLVAASTTLVAVGADGRGRALPAALRQSLEGAIEG